MDNRTRTVVAALSVGTLLSPLNSSMIAVALVPLRHDFGLDAAEVTWVVTVFYLASATGQPLMGRLGDRFGPRRVFTIGMAATVIVCAATVWVTSFGMLCVGRAGLALTSAVAFPCAITIIRPLSRSSGVPPSHLLGRIQIASTAGAAVGPVLGGVLETMYGWQAIMAINIPLATLAAVGAALAPPDTARTAGSLLSLIFLVMLLITRSVVAAIVIVGTVAFSYSGAFGLSVLVWQHFLGIPLSWLTLPLTFIILVAVGSDYNLLLIARYLEESAAGLNTGLIRAVANSGKVVTTAGMVFAVTMMAMLSSDLMSVGQFGATIGVGLLLDTMIVRSFITPAIARLLKPLFWWPRIIRSRPAPSPKPPMRVPSPPPASSPGR
jgi:MFS family permease